MSIFDPLDPPPALVQIKHLELLAQQIREQGDQQQVLLSLDGVSQTITLADELWLIAYLLRDALDLPTCPTSPGQDDPS